eukprot:14011296-Alexandrium_andersonii.AAC.1
MIEAPAWRRGANESHAPLLHCCRALRRGSLAQLSRRRSAHQRLCGSCWPRRNRSVRPRTSKGGTGHPGL